nr:myb-like protein Q isoform X1 [Ipomoea batatas]
MLHQNMKKKAGTTNSSEASKPKERHIVSWSQEEDDILREHIRVHGSDKQPALSEESAGSSEYSTGSTLLAHGVGDNREKSEAELCALHQDTESGLQSTYIDDEFAKGISGNASTSQGLKDLLIGVENLASNNVPIRLFTVFICQLYRMYTM